MYAPVWRKINQILDYLREIQVAHGRNVRVTRTMNGTLLLGEAQAQEAPPPSPPVTRYRVKNFLLSGDVLVCNRMNEDGSVVTEETLIARPFNLRQSDWNNQLISYQTEGYPEAPTNVTVRYVFQNPVYRIARIETSTGSTDEHQIVVPRYIANFSVIYAAEPENGTGLSNATLVDLNVDGRGWARAL